MEIRFRIPGWVFFLIGVLALPLSVEAYRYTDNAVFILPIVGDVLLLMICSFMVGRKFGE